MSTRNERRGFHAAGAAASPSSADEKIGSDKRVRIGVVGAGLRGCGLLDVLLTMPKVEVPAICGMDADRVSAAQDAVLKTGRGKPEAYSQGPDAWRALMDRDDLDAVIIASSWPWHAPMAVYAMKAGKYAAVEVPVALSVEECWDLVNTSEATGVPCMMLENWSFRRDNLAVLNMIRHGLFGEIVHCHCAHSHDCIDHWFFDLEGKIQWGGEYLVQYNRDHYPTHSLGPVLSWMDINCGDSFAYLTSTATASLGINRHFAKKFGPDHPHAKRQYAQGDIVTSVVRTQKGRTIVINYDMQLPRPYDNRWMIQGTDGLYDEDKAAVYIEGRSPKYHEWEPFAPYQEKYDHSWWRSLGAEAGSAGHDGTDYIELHEFVKAVRDKTQTPIDVYDSVTMSVIIPLSEQSIAKGSTPVECPDFTRGKWKTNKPRFAVEDV